MKFLKAIWQFLTVKKEATNVTDQVVETAPTTAEPTTAATVTAQPTATVVSEPTTVQGVTTDAVLAKLKTLLIAAGHDIEEEFDEAVAYAKTLAAKL